MFTFPDKGVAPGVYIREIDRPGPIAGVGTSTAAIIGPAQRGPMGAPTRVTNPTQLENVFGTFLPTPRLYAVHAAHGFLANGGSQLFFVRVGTGAHASLELDDTGGDPTLVVRAKKEGAAGDGITVEVKDASLADTKLAKGSATLAGAGASGTAAVVDDASKFAPGDRVLFDDGSGTTEEATVSTVDTAADKLTLSGALAGTFAAGESVRIADVAAGRSKVRVENASKLEKGSYVTIAAGGTPEGAVVHSVEPTTGTVTLSKPLTNAYPLGSGDPDVTVKSREFVLTVKHPDHPAEVSQELAMDARHSRYWGRTFESDHVELAAPEPPNAAAPPANRPAEVDPAVPLAGGADDDPGAVPDAAYTAALAALEKVDEVAIVLAPGVTKKALQQAVIDHCTTMQDRFAIVDPEAGAAPSAVETQRAGLTVERGFAAIYYPWIVVSDPLGTGELALPPSGHVAGVYARVDVDRGVHKAPANETLRGVIGLERQLTDADQAPLNDVGINAIRIFPGRGIRVWGARTMASDAETQWRYVNVRRLMLFLEESIQEGTQSAVFEPNNEALWETLKRQVGGFLNRVWRSGALVGTVPEEAYRVRIDTELNPPEVRALGQLRIEVRVAPTTPAEFIVFFITHQPGETIVDE